MPLARDSLSQRLEQIFSSRPASVAQAAFDWASAYASYAAGAVSTAGSLPLTALANQGMLSSAWAGALGSQSSATAASLMVQGLNAYWLSMLWVGPAAVGITSAPGNLALLGELSSIFADTGDEGAAGRARRLSQAFDAGAKLVVVTDIPKAQPAPPIVGPIS
jgi:hypothetical protein